MSPQGRLALVLGGLAGLLVAVAAAALFLGSAPISPGAVIGAVTGRAAAESVERVYRIVQRGGPARAEGYRVGQTLMSYIHLHFASNPELPRAFVRACAGSHA